MLGQQRIAIVETATGRMQEAHSRLVDALAMATASDSPMVKVHSLTRLYGTLALNRLEAGDRKAATRYIERGFRVQRTVGECVPCDVLMYPAAVPLYMAAGDFQKADEACRRLEEAANGFGSRAWIAQARHLRGKLLGEYQEWERAKSLLREAHATYEELEQPYERAQVAAELADVVLRGPGAAGDEDPETLLKNAGATYETLGARARRDSLNRQLAELFA